MANRRSSWLACVGLLALLSGCVERRFVIETTPPGAKVYVNNRPIGSTPVDMPFVYYGKYRITLELDGHQTRTIDEDVPTKWYEYPPVDFVSENVYPFKLSDVRRLHYDMSPLQRPNLEELRFQAEALREEARNLPPSTVPPEPPPAGNGTPPAGARPSTTRTTVSPPPLEPTP